MPAGQEAEQLGKMLQQMQFAQHMLNSVLSRYPLLSPFW
jgi:hypothetical protein